MVDKILVTGGFGFIGTTLVQHLLAQSNAQIHVVDDMSTSPIDLDDFLDQVDRPQRLSYTINPVHEFIAHAEPHAWTQIYHLASPVGPAGILKHAGEMIRTVVRDGYALIDYCRKGGSRLLDVSTSEIYGGGVGGLCAESTSKIVQPKTTVRLEYAIAKLAVETAIINHCKTGALNAVIIRPFNVAGPRQSPRGGFVLPRFVQQADSGRPLTVFGDGSAVRAFTHVSDVALGIIRAMQKGGNGTAYNVGNPENKTTILDLAKRVRRVLESRSEIHFVDPKTIYGQLYEEASDKFPDAGKAMSELGWEPKYGIDETILAARDEFVRQRKRGVLKDQI